MYLLRCCDGSFYTGITTCLERRVDEHNHSQRGAAYTRGRRPVELVYSEKQHDRSSAARREAVVRRLRPQQKQQLAECYQASCSQ